MTALDVGTVQFAGKVTWMCRGNRVGGDFSGFAKTGTWRALSMCSSAVPGQSNTRRCSHRKTVGGSRWEAAAGGFLARPGR